MTDAIDPPTEVPPDADPARCPYCERPFADADRRALHVGEVHTEAMDEAEAHEYDQARESEDDEMWVYHFKVVVVLLALYMATGLVYLIALG